MNRSASFAGVRVRDTRASQRRSFAGRISHRVASGLSFANLSFGEARSGTVVGTVINTLCSVIGGGVLSLPLALYFSSVVVGLGLLLMLASFAAFSVYLLVVGCDATGRYSITEVVAFALYPPQLWEEFLSQKANERYATGPTTGGALSSSSSSAGAAAQHHLRDGKSKSGRGVGEDGAEAGAATSLGESGAGHDASRQRRSRRHPPAPVHPPAESSASHAEADEHAALPPTSAYAGLRDAYARQEWQSRRRRRLATMVMEFIVFCSNYGTLVMYAKVIADSMPPVVSYLLNTDGMLAAKNFWLLTGGVVFFFLSCVRNMEELKWTSLLGFLTIFYIVMVVLFRYHTKQVNDYPHVDPVKYGSIHWLRFSVKILQTVSTFGFAFSYHYNVPYFYKELEDRRPRRMMQSIAIAFPIIVFCYAATGVFGYLTFGDEVASKRVGGNIVSNYAKNDLPINIGRLGLFAHFACVFPVVSICTRRGLHRLLMIGLTWGEQSALMREAAVAAGATLTPEETGAARGEEGAETEASPLLHAGAAAPAPTGYEVFSSSAPHQPAGTHGTAATSSAAPSLYQSLASPRHGADDSGENEWSHLLADAEPETVDVDRDVGSPDLTTTLAIVLEAGFLVVTSVLIAATVSGIDFVIMIIGTLFSVFLVMVAPGLVGYCVFSPDGPFGSATAAVAAYATMQNRDDEEGSGAGVGVGGRNDRSSHLSATPSASRFRLIRLKRAMCVVNMMGGICITCIGVSVLVYDTVWDVTPPSV